jgi:large subunit ribosomal protein L45
VIDRSTTLSINELNELLTQVLAVYDRFGRLAHGSEVIAKDVLEYVVFEKHLANIYGIWRIHGKIIPSWAHNEDISPRTFKVSV